MSKEKETKSKMTSIRLTPSTLKRIKKNKVNVSELVERSIEPNKFDETMKRLFLAQDKRRKQRREAKKKREQEIRKSKSK